MFLFQSSEQKAIRLDVERNMDVCLSNPKNYEFAKMALVSHLRKSDQRVIEMIVDHIKATIKNQDLQPIRKYQAILLLKDLMLTHNKALGKYVVKKILKRLTILAQHKCDSKEMDRQDERAKDIFGPVKNDQEKYANQFFNTLLMALEQWGKKWPRAPDGPYKDFHQVYNDLVMNHVRFPKQRPKQTIRQSVSPINRNSKQEKNNSLPKKQIEKPTLKQPSNIVKKSSSSGNFSKQITQFFNQLVESLSFLSSLLPALSGQGQEGYEEQMDTLEDIINGINTPMVQKGDQFMIKAQEAGAEAEIKKIQNSFAFLEAILKDVKILKKKPEQLQAFRKKYIRKTKAIQDLLQNQSTNLKASQPQKIEQPASKPTASSIIKPSGPSISIIQPQVDKKQKPKIQKNRFSSTQGNNMVLEATPKNAQEFGSQGGHSQGSNKFGSFGGLPSHTQRHRASIPIQGQLSPDKNMPKTQRMSSQITKSKSPEQQPIPEERPSSQNNFRQIQKFNNNKTTKNQFPQFQPSDKVKQTDSFGSKQFGVNKPQQQEDDFFATQEQKQKSTKQLNQDPRRDMRRKKTEKQPEANPVDFFQQASQVGSQGGLSGFDFSHKAIQTSINNPVAAAQQPVSNKQHRQSLGLQDPFASMRKSQQSENKSNFFDFGKGGQVSDIFGKSDISKRSRTSYSDADCHKAEPQNRFQTGNFGKPVSINNKSPFDVDSVKSKSQNPFNNASFDKISKKSNPFEAGQTDKKSTDRKNNNPFEQKSNPFEQDSDPYESKVEAYQLKKQENSNPFQTSTHKSNKSKNPFESKINPSQDPFEKQTQKSQKSLNPFDTLYGNNQTDSNKNLFKKANKPFAQFQSAHNQPSQVGAVQYGQPVRNSLALQVQFQQQQNSVHFSQFGNIGQNKQSQQALPKQNKSFSGFSLSEFQGVGEPVRKESRPSADDFFKDFDKKSASQKSQQSMTQKQEKDMFDLWNVNKSEKSNKTISKERPALQQEKTVKSRSQASFNFENQNFNQVNPSKIGLKQTDSYYQGDKKKNENGDEAQSRSQKQLSWGDFDIASNFMNPVGSPRSPGQQKDLKVNPSNQDLGVQSRIILPSSKSHQQLSADQKRQQDKESSKGSVNFKLQDFAPVAKRGYEWNPLGKLANLKQASITYNIQQNVLLSKKKQLQYRKQQYEEKMKCFKRVKQQSEQVRNMMIEKLKKSQQVLMQKRQYEVIQTAINERNDQKQKKIDTLHRKIKKLRELKEKILYKQKQLFDLTKNNVNSQDNGHVQRSMAAKWQLFNKNLSQHRTTALSAQTKYSIHY